ncbi:VP1 [Green River chinook virus]|uniref:VP1 n=1 Tax=Green River chinook virus TaxID=1382300 RepID=W6EJ20_9REOV|nr:VP1 [Green River chinook virus]AHJ14801.1 VP1 [Green River chinook virus]
MATVFGIQLTNRLNTATVRRPFHPRRYDSYITTFTTQPGINQLFRAVDYDPVDHTATFLQCNPPLNAWNPSPQFNPSDLPLGQWRRWLTDRCRALATTLQRHFPLVVNAPRLVNPIVIGMVTSAFLNSESIHLYLPYLFYDPGVAPILHSILQVDQQFSHSTFVVNKVLYTPAGVKYLALRFYDPSSPSAPCSFGKHVPSYALVAYYSDETSRLSAIHRYTGGQLILEHFDQPTYAPHLIIPRLGSPIGYGASSPNQGDLLLVESVIDAFRQNSSSGPSTAVARIDQTYHPVMNCQPADMTLLSSRLLNLALMAVQGCQTVSPMSNDPPMSEVNGFLSRVMSPGDPQLLAAYRADYEQIWRNSPFPIGANPRYQSVRQVNRFSLGTVTHVPNSSQPLQFLPQYRNANVTKANGLASYNTQRLLPIAIYHGHAVTGGTYFTSRNISGDPAAPWPIANLPPLPPLYFSAESRTRRELLSRLRHPSDRSLLKDTANFNFLATLLNSATNDPVLYEGFSLAYLGAASTHGDVHEPLILDALRLGSIPGVPIPSKIGQFGYDVESGSLMDTTLASPTGTYGVVYSDVDQVEDAGDRIDLADRAAIATMLTALNMTTAGGVTVLKINFPTVAMWTQLFHRFATMARELHIVKPLIVNSVEVYVIFSGRANDGNLTPSPALHQYLIELFARATNLMSVMRHVPLLVDVDDGTSSLGINACRQYSPDLPLAVATPDLQSLAYQLATIVPSTSYMSKEDFDGTSALTFYGKRTFLSALRLARLRNIPLPATTALRHQSRLTGPPSFQLFPVKPASVNQLMAACYNFILHAALQAVAPPRLIDCGTGPEARILSIVPAATDLLMVDQRPSAEAITSFNPALVSYVMADFMDPAFWNNRQTNAITSIFSFGAACAAANLDLIAGLTAFLQSTRLTGAGHFWLQLNSPLSPLVDIPGLITIDTRRAMYSFNGGQRQEPYALPDAILAAIRVVYPNATFTWLTPSPSMDWIEYVLGLGSAIDFDTIQTVRDYGLLTPILHVDLTQPPMVVPIPLVVGVQAVLQVAAPTNQTTVVGSIAGVQVFTGDIAASQSTIGPIQFQWDVANLRWDITLTPNQAGVLDVHVVDGPANLNRGSTNINLPPATIVIAAVVNPDFTNQGNDAAIQCDMYYRLGVFVSVAGVYQPVNLERAVIMMINNVRTLHYVHDLSDNHVLMYVCDIGDNTIGRSIAHPLADIFRIQFPNNVPLLASPPYPNASGRLMLNGQNYLDLDPLPPVLPPAVVLQQLSTAVQTGRDTVEVPVARTRMWSCKTS